MMPNIEYAVYGGEDFSEWFGSSSDLEDAKHFMFIYGQDGPVRLVKETTYQETIDQTT